MTHTSPTPRSFPVGLYALTAGAFGIGTTEFVIMGLLLQVAGDLHVSIAAAGMLVSGYALGVFVGAPLLTVATGGLSRKATLVALMLIFTLGNWVSALAPTYAVLMTARIITSLAHGTFFGVGAVVATGLVTDDRRASAISIMFTGLTVATLLGVPAGAWLGHAYGWRAAFWAVTFIGVAATIIIVLWVPRDRAPGESKRFFEELRGIVQPQVLLGLLTTVLGFAGVFTVFTYIQVLLTSVAGFADRQVSPILLVFGAGLVAGNLVGGRLADRMLSVMLLGSLGALAAVLGAMTFALHSRPGMIVFAALLGFAAFATVAPLQLRVLHKAAGRGQTLASSFNIAAFNLGNAIGAWLGGWVITQGPGMGSVPWVASLVTLSGLAVAFISLRLDDRAGGTTRHVVIQNVS